MDPNRRAIAFWILRVGIAVVLVILLQAWTGPDPVLWWLAVGYALLSGLTTWVLIRRNK
jgi:LPXTG-motif cell wall-anchored protein